MQTYRTFGDMRTPHCLSVYHRPLSRPQTTSVGFELLLQNFILLNKICIMLPLKIHAPR